MVSFFFSILFFLMVSCGMYSNSVFNTGCERIERELSNSLESSQRFPVKSIRDELVDAALSGAQVAKDYALELESIRNNGFINLFKGIHEGAKAKRAFEPSVNIICRFRNAMSKVFERFILDTVEDNIMRFMTFVIDEQNELFLQSVVSDPVKTN